MLKALKRFWDDLTASTVILGCVLIAGAALSWIFLGSATNSEVSEACGSLTWPLLVGKWEDRVLPAVGEQHSREPIHLLLYPGGEAVKNGRRGTWKIVTCEGPTLLIDLPRRKQIDSCELRVDTMDPEQPRGALSCADSEHQIRRAETRGFVSGSAVRLVQWKREDNRRYEREMAKATGWSRVLVWCRLKFLPWVEPEEFRRTPASTGRLASPSAR